MFFCFKYKRYFSGQYLKHKCWSLWWANLVVTYPREEEKRSKILHESRASTVRRRKRSPENQHRTEKRDVQLPKSMRLNSTGFEAKEIFPSCSACVCLVVLTWSKCRSESQGCDEAEKFAQDHCLQQTGKKLLKVLRVFEHSSRQWAGKSLNKKIKLNSYIPY